MTGFLYDLEKLIADRQSNPKEGSYTNQLLEEGIHRISQKVGEEAVEVVIAAVSNNISELENESADLLYHLMVLLAERGVSLDSVLNILESRN